MDYTDVTDEGLGHLKDLNQLVELSLDSVRVTDSGLMHLEGLVRLKSLNLYHTLVTEEGYKRLRAALPDCKIVWDPESALPNRRRS